MRSEQEMAQELTRYLIDRDRYNGTSPLESMVKTEISAMARSIAKRVVEENPAIQTAIEERTRLVIGLALRDDAYLSTVVSGAVARALGQLVQERQAEEDGLPDE